MIVKRKFGVTSDGQEVSIYSLINSRKHELKVLDYGARVHSLIMQDKDGNPIDVILGYTTVVDYENDDKCMGGIIGRHANRIADSKVTIDGVTYNLEPNAGNGNHIHGGSKAFHFQMWEAKVGADVLKLTYSSPDGEAGYPGNLTLDVTYRLSDDDEFIIEYEAVSDKDTICNPTCHAYFNLNGATSGAINNHRLMVLANKFTYADKDSFPTGEILPVDGTPLDFRKLTAIGERIDSDYEQLVWGKGYDHNYVVPNANGKELKKIAYVEGDKTAINMECHTTAVGMQLYTANYLDGMVEGKEDCCYGEREAFCLETQYYPNSPANPHFPQPIIKADEKWRSKTVYKFGVAR